MLLGGNNYKYFQKLYRGATFVAGSKGKHDLGLKETYCPGVSKQKGHVSFEFKRINLQAASWAEILASRVGGGWGDPQHLVQPQQQQQEGDVLSLVGQIISPVGSLIIGIICSPGLFSDKLIPRQGKAV